MEELDSSQRLQLDVLEEEYRRRHGVAVEWLKAAVGEGETYENEVARAVISDNGAWFECLDLPMEFSGSAGGPCDHRFVSDTEMRELVSALRTVTETGTGGLRHFGLLVLYNRGGIVDDRSAYVFQTRTGSDSEPVRPIRAGEWREDAPPLLIRCRIDGRAPVEGVPIRSGVLVCLCGVGERNLLLLMPREGHGVRDLGALELSPLPH